MSMLLNFPLHIAVLREMLPNAGGILHFHEENLAHSLLNFPPILPLISYKNQQKFGQKCPGAFLLQKI